MTSAEDDIDAPKRSSVLQARWMLPIAVGLVAVGVRWLSVQHSGGLHALLGYDEGVYFGASTSWVSGLVPYRDFVLVHPPGSTVLLAPFALLGRMTSDSTGWAAARLAIIALGGVNAALVTIIARRVSGVAAIVAGLLYAVWAPAVHVERTTMLEVFVLAGIIVALWALRRPDDATWRLIVAGGALGLGSTTKLWGLVPFGVIVGWLVLARAWRSAAIVVSAGAIAFLAVVAPFAAVAPQRMFDLVVRAQLGRGRGGTHELDRLARMFNIDVSRIVVSGHREALAGAIALAVIVLMAGIAWWRVPRSRLWAALLGVQLVVLMAVPVYFEGYSSFIVPALMLTAGTAASVAWTAVVGLRPTGRVLGKATLALAVTIVAAGSLVRSLHPHRDLVPHLEALALRTESAQCVGSDAAGLLILTDTLTRNIDRGCPTVLDFDGTVYSFDDGANPDRLSSTQRRRQSAQYQKAMQDYFAANDVLLVHRALADTFDASTRARLIARPVIYREHGLRVFGQALSSAD